MDQKQGSKTRIKNKDQKQSKQEVFRIVATTNLTI